MNKQMLEMLVSILGKLIPKEVMGQITPEKANEIIGNIQSVKNSFDEMNARLVRIEEYINGGSSDNDRGNSTLNINRKLGNCD